STGHGKRSFWRPPMLTEATSASRQVRGHAPHQIGGCPLRQARADSIEAFIRYWWKRHQPAEPAGPAFVSFSDLVYSLTPEHYTTRDIKTAVDDLALAGRVTLEVSPTNGRLSVLLVEEGKARGRK